MYSVYELIQIDSGSTPLTSTLKQWSLRSQAIIKTV